MQELYEPRTFKGREGFGPFAKEADFYQFLGFGIQNGKGILKESGRKSWITEEEKSEMRKVVDMQNQLQESHKICFTHGNAIVQTS